MIMCKYLRFLTLISTKKVSKSLGMRIMDKRWTSISTMVSTKKHGNNTL